MVSPFDWSKYVEGIESTVSVPPEGPFNEGDQPAGGYLGG